MSPLILAIIGFGFVTVGIGAYLLMGRNDKDKHGQTNQKKTISPNHSINKKPVSEKNITIETVEKSEVKHIVAAVAAFRGTLLAGRAES